MWSFIYFTVERLQTIRANYNSSALKYEFAGFWREFDEIAVNARSYADILKKANPNLLMEFEYEVSMTMKEKTFSQFQSIDETINAIKYRARSSTTFGQVQSLSDELSSLAGSEITKSLQVKDVDKYNQVMHLIFYANTELGKKMKELKSSEQDQLATTMEILDTFNAKKEGNSSLDWLRFDY